MAPTLTFTITTTPFDEDYTPSSDSRLTTNFANLARGEHREQNIRAALTTIDERLNSLLPQDNPQLDRYRAELVIVSAALGLPADAPGLPADAPALPAGAHRGRDGAAPLRFPLLEMLDVTILDRRTGERRAGIVGNNLSSYVRDYDFSVLLPSLAERGAAPPEDFGELHGKLFDAFLASPEYRERFAAPPVICISVSTSRTYRRGTGRHPVLGVEYLPEDPSRTDAYFAKMGLRARFFLPDGGVAPLALYHRGDLLRGYSDVQLAGTIATMETFQRIYRPEIYNAASPAGEVFQPSLAHAAFTRMPVTYDRDERAQLGPIQGEYTREHLIAPHGELLQRWAAEYPAPTAGGPSA